MSRVVVSNVQVLTAGTKFDQDAAKDGRPVPSTVVTLLVTPDDAERIALASSVGSIMLTLRNPLDKDATETKGTHTAALMGAPDPAPVTKVVNNVPRIVRPAAPPTPPAPSTYSVTVFKAAKKTSEDLKR
jgi:pilus assembly protein CpaB